MATIASLHWLPQIEEFRARLKAMRSLSGEAAWSAAVALAAHRLDFVQTNALDQAVQAACPAELPVGDGVRTVRLAILGSSTTTHLHAGIRVAGLRRNIRIVTYESDYGQYRQELLDTGSPLHAFRPDIVLFALDAHHLTAGLRAGLEEGEAQEFLEAMLQSLTGLWKVARETLGATVLQQTVLPVFFDLLGGNEHRLPGSRAFFVDRLNDGLRLHADADGIHLLAVDRWALRHGIDTWHDAALWHRSKQEVALHATPFYGDLVGRLLAALSGRSYKALVLDLDNTLWGGVIGDDGMEGIVLGSGSATGEAFADVQRYAGELSERGVILAVCSKNTHEVAAKAFDEHPEMVLKRSQIASFAANWTDKAANIRQIAKDLNIGLDALVFLDDNPFERTLVRQELPMVAVPEVPEDPALVPRCLADAGYFESVAITADDRERTRQYQLNHARMELAASATDMDSYIRSLEMRLQWSPFEPVNLARTTQLINKTNQFNLRTRRYSEEDVRAVMANPNAFGITLRLLDRFGDNGIIAIVIGERTGDEVFLDTWLMSCRVLGRRVEQATLAVVAQEAARIGGTALVGEYVPSSKNGMVQEHYPKLGFLPDGDAEGGIGRYRLALGSLPPAENFMHIERI